MKNKSLAALLVLLLLFGIAVGAQAESAEGTVFTSGDWSYRVRSDGNLEIIRWYGKGSELVIPAAIEGKKVVAIGNDAFSEEFYLASVTIPDGVTGIGDFAFQDCWSLSCITIPDSVVSIGINPFLFDVLQINISPSHPVLALIDNALINKPEKRLIAYLKSSKSKTYNIPQGILSIGEQAFCGCNLASITIPDSITSIGPDAFLGCASLTSITIPDSVTSIGDSAFSFCNSLTSVIIPDSVTSIGDSAFSSCISLSGVIIPASVTSIGDSAFSSCISLSGVIIPASVTHIGTDVFNDCPNSLRITVAHDSYAKEYAEENHLSYTYADALD